MAMLCLWSRLLSPPPVAQTFLMLTPRLYSSGGGGGVKPGRRAGLMEAPPPAHHPAPPPSSYHLYPGHPDAKRGAAPFHHHSHYPPQYHFHSVGVGPVGAGPVGAGSVGGCPASGGRKKTWSFIQEKMSYDTFFTMKRLIERSLRPDEVLRWITQNPSKISHNHYPVALQRIGQLLGGGPNAGGARQVLEQHDFQTLCNAIVSDCSKFDNFSIVNCLYAVAALGLPSDSQVVQVLEAESESRLNQFNQKDVSMRNLERERHPQTLFLLLSCYRLKLRELQERANAAAAAGDASAAAGDANGATESANSASGEAIAAAGEANAAATGEASATAAVGANGAADDNNSSSSNPEQLLASRKILRLVKHTLVSVSGVRDQEMALLDEMLAACVREASNKSLEMIFSSHLFYQNRQERFIRSLAGEMNIVAGKALIAKYIARHRLRETRLLDTIADFLVKRAEYLDSVSLCPQVIQKLVFPFSRMSYRPCRDQVFFSRLEEVLELKALNSPLATVNILMSLFQLGHFPGLVMHRVFSSAFISNVTNSPYALIVRRYLSLLDAAVELEYPEYSGPRLQDAHKVLIYKGLVGEALRQLLGEHNYRQDQVLAPGYHTDFLLLIGPSGRVLPVRPAVAMASPAADSAVAVVTSEFQKFSPFVSEEEGAEPLVQGGGASEPRGGGASECFLPPGSNGGSYRAPEIYKQLSENSSTLSSPPSGSLGPPPQGPPGHPPPDPLFQFSIGRILEDEGGADCSFYCEGGGRGAAPPPQTGGRAETRPEGGALR
ncbi:Fas-activated serine/threonine kinase [Dissostichus eleginoides]|uniref:Fas-activated serine/threonine kinase n=1 Tax=Dissostichus eleginoides TaxID=100907 RepID=A0AAD9B0X5_DISEL|nr:Fas-activated serine/threonine kinase [Dissostichus eleginoides]